MIGCFIMEVRVTGAWDSGVVIDLVSESITCGS